MKKSKRNLLLGTGAVAAGICATVAATSSVTKKLVGIAMDRELPEEMAAHKSKLAGSEKADEMLEYMAAQAEALENLGCETVEIESHDGLRLVGHWQNCETPKRVIVAMHGWRSSWAKEFGSIYEFWHSNDCCVLYAEQRAHGESQGEFMSFGLLERYDCLDWVNWVNERTGGKLPIYLCGVSMGATTVLMAAGLELPANVRGIIADCGFTSPYAIWKHVVTNNLHLPFNGVSSLLADRLCMQKIDASPRDYSTVDAMRECKIPVLFVHGEDDHFVPKEMTLENYEACAAPKRLLTVPGAEHGMSYLLARPEYEKEVLALWSWTNWA